MQSIRPTLILLCAAATAHAQNCANTSTGRIPLSDLGSALYLNQFQGGLYPGGINQPPPAHAAAGLARAAAIAPLDTFGQPSPTGRIVMLSIGMSNTTQEFCSGGGNEPCDPYTFMGRATRRGDLDRQHLVIANGAAGGQTAPTWDQPTDINYNRVLNQILIPRGLSEAQVQVAWVKLANAQPTASLPDPAADAYILFAQLGNVARAMKVRYPNLQLIFLSSRIYGGYATGGLNPEPFAYESGFSVKWLIEAQINQIAGAPPHSIAGDLNYNTVAPWLAWGPYLWADGLTPRSDGLTWACSDFAADGVHPALGMDGARAKVGAALTSFFFASPFAAPWLRASSGSACYANCDGSTQPPVLNVADFSCFMQAFSRNSTFGNCDASSTQPLLNVADFSCFLQRFALGCQ